MQNILNCNFESAREENVCIFNINLSLIVEAYWVGTDEY